MAKQNIFTELEQYITSKYEIRKNTIALQFEIKKKSGKNWNILNENNLYIEINKADIKCSINQLITLLKSNFIKEYNPIKDYLTSNYEANKNIDVNIFKKFTDYIKTNDDDFFHHQLTKWFVRCVKCAMEPDYFNKQALIFIGGQNSGKTSLLRFICPPILSNYYSENFAHDKDNRIMLAKNFIINIDELAALSKYDINALKSYFSKTIINERLPYEQKNSILYRCANFVGSTNQNTFLNDETGSVRWLCFELNKIDYSYSKNIDINHIWAGAYKLYLHKKFNAEIQINEIHKIQNQNRDYQIRSVEMELLEKYFKPTPNELEGLFLTATEIMEDLNLQATNKTKINVIAIGKALTFLGYKRTKLNNIYGYYLIPINRIQSKL